MIVIVSSELVSLSYNEDEGHFAGEVKIEYADLDTDEDSNRRSLVNVTVPMPKWVRYGRAERKLIETAEQKLSDSFAPMEPAITNIFVADPEEDDSTSAAAA